MTVLPAPVRNVDHPRIGHAAPVDERVRLGAALLWDQRSNPAWWEPRTPIGLFVRDEAASGCLAAWQSDDGAYHARLQRAERGSRAYLVLWRGTQFLGTYDNRGWHTATGRNRHTRQGGGGTLPLPLVALASTAACRP